MRLFAENSTVATRALQIYIILIGAAHRRETTTYGILADKIGFKGAGVLAERLGPIMRWCAANELPSLTAIVVNQKLGIPGEGLELFSESTLMAEQQRVFEFDWYSIFPPTVEDLETFRKEEI